MLGVLNGTDHLAQHNHITWGNYAKYSITQNKNVCAPDQDFGFWDFSLLVGGGCRPSGCAFLFGRNAMQENTSATTQSVPTIFSYNECQVRTLTHDDGAIWFVARDVCKALDISWQGSKTLNSIPEAWSMVGKLPTTHKNQHGAESKMIKDAILVNEPAVYKLAFRSNKPEADRFTNWVASEVLPSIRKTGAYAIPIKDMKPETLTPSEQHQLSLAVKIKSEGNPKALAEIWSRINNNFKVARYFQIERESFHEALTYLSEMEVKALKKEIPETDAERSILIDDIYLQLGRVREMANALIFVHADLSKSVNKIGNLVSILYTEDYKARRVREREKESGVTK